MCIYLFVHSYLYSKRAVFTTPGMQRRSVQALADRRYNTNRPFLLLDPQTTLIKTNLFFPLNRRIELNCRIRKKLYQKKVYINNIYTYISFQKSIEIQVYVLFFLYLPISILRFKPFRRVSSIRRFNSTRRFNSITPQQHAKDQRLLGAPLGSAPQCKEFRHRIEPSNQIDSSD